MKKLFVCEICDAIHHKEEDAIACEEQGANPLYEIGQKVLYCGNVVTIFRRDICRLTHSFIYIFHMLPEDNPAGKTLTACGWKNESQLQKLPQQD